jgi:predicted RNase H-like HicB family nuclease
MQYTIVLETNEEGGFAARCVEIPGTVYQGANKGEALARLKEAIGQVQQARQADLHRTIQSLSSEIIRIEVADAA